MPKKRFSEEQIAFALRQAECGTSVGEICRKMGVADATFYRWKKVYAGMGVSEIRRLKQLEEENTKLKRGFRWASHRYQLRREPPGSLRISPAPCLAPAGRLASRRECYSVSP